MLRAIFEIVVALLVIEGLRSVWRRFKEWRELRWVKKRIVDLRQLEKDAANAERK